MARTTVTECPACFTRFRVTPGQLRQAGGKVRCGACLLVFKAGDPPEKQLEIAPYNPEPDVDFGRHNINLDPEQPSTRRDLDDMLAGLQPDQDEQRLKAERASAQARRKQAQDALKAEKAAKLAAEKQSRARKAAEAEAARKQAAKIEQARQEAVQKAAAARKAQQQKRAEAARAAGENYSDNPLLESLAMESIQLSSPRPVRQPLHTAAWLTASLLALMLLATQFLWFERQNLAWQSPWHNLYRGVCQLTGCKLPTRQALKQIRSQQMLVQDHPDYQEALQIRLILENQARFTQPWPALDLHFTDLKGRQVAGRRFQPVDYLDVNRINPLTMPAGQPVQVSLDIMQPGARAVSYSLSIVKPDNGK